MSTGTGWPFGGPNVTPEMMATQASVEKFAIEGGQRRAEPLSAGSVVCVTAYGPNGAVEDLTAFVTAEKTLDWTAPEGSWTVYVMSTKATEQVVERAAPGAEGYVLNPFSAETLAEYLKVFDASMGEGPWPRAQYHDSYEYTGNWSATLFARFEAMHGYDLRDHVAALSGEGDTTTVAAVRHDYRATMAALLHDYTAAWVAWSHGHGCTTRNQAHGSPGNILDLYGAADIPETEIFGSSGFPIPGLDRGVAVPDGDKPNPLMMKFASSAAHVLGKPLVSSETCTWMAEHFQETLSLAKPQVDELFQAGVNHIFYHGTAYSPRGAAWPGWLFYASTNFGPTSPFFRDFRALNDYAARCQAMLREGRPDNDVLLYFPIHDVWQEAETKGWLRQLTVHHIEWMSAGGFHDIADTLHKRGYAFDYISDAMLAEASVDGPDIATPGGTYRTIVIPNCRYLTVEVVEHLHRLAAQGATIVTLAEELPRAPGLYSDSEQVELDALLAGLAWEARAGGIAEASVGMGRLVRGNDVEALLNEAGVPREPMTELGLSVIRRRIDGGHVYFISNLSSGYVDHWVELGRACAGAVIMDPMREDRIGVAALRDAVDGATESYLQLRPGESLVMKTQAEPAEGPPWRYEHAGTITAIDGPWDVAFVEGGPALPADTTMEKAASWTTLDDPAAKVFSGAATYSTTFEVADTASAADWVLGLGDVRESARVRVNGNDVATLFAIPFRVSIGDFVKTGTNTLDDEVTSPGDNRIADMDRRGVEWRIFYEINYVNIKYKPFDASSWPPMPSGLLGPVRLEASQAFDPKAEAPSVESLAAIAPGWRGEILASIDQSNVGWDVEIGDADNDGANEVLVTGCPDSRLIMLEQRDQGWLTRLLAQDLAHRSPEPGMGLTVKVVDLNGDARNELIVGTGQEGMSAGPAYFYVMECDGARAITKAVMQATMGESLFTHNFGVADLDGDGVQEVLSAYCGTGEIMRYDVNADLTEIAGRQIHENPGSGEDSFIADIDHDGQLEYLTADCYREGEARILVFEFDAQGELVKPARVVIEGYDDVKCFNVSLEVGDVDNDGTLNLIAMWKERFEENTGTLLGYTIDQSGATVAHTFAKREPALDLGFGEKMMCVGDVDNDGANELVVSTRGETQWEGGGLGHVILYEIEGGAVRQTMLANFHEGVADASWIAVGDADNDGKNEVVVATGRGHRERPGISQVVLLERDN